MKDDWDDSTNSIGPPDDTTADFINMMEVGDTFTNRFDAMVDLVGLLGLNRAQLLLLPGAFSTVGASTGRLSISGKMTELLGCNTKLTPFFSMLGLEGHKGSETF